MAVSGGADSVFLLHALREAGVAVAVLHVNHQLRGVESDLDEAFVRSMAAEMGLDFHLAAQPVTDGNLEQQARRARYAFFGDCIAAGICDSVATGHTLDDQAETVLGRFLRGAGTAGLSGIRPVTEARVIRPLLGFCRDDIRKSLRERGIPWREDQSNTNTDFLRNRLRLEIMPTLTELNPSLPHVLASTATWAQAEEEYWSGEIARLEPKLLSRSGEAVLIRTGSLQDLPVATQRRLLRKAVEVVRGSLRSIDFRHIEAMRNLTASREGSGRMQLPDLDVYRSFDWLRLAPVGFDSRLERDFAIELRIPGRTCMPERQLTIDLELVTPAHVYNNQMNVLDWSLCAGSHAGPLMLRNWRPGDSYHPVGKSGAQKIKILFQECRVPLWERRTWPVITQGSSILWARHFGPSVEFAAGPDSGQILAIREAGESNRCIRTSNEVDARDSNAGCKVEASQE
ncbi:MAG: tRNA(Ile)-lysidine synthase [Bryobacterales bacterium]|nr:tRNA(Ile)-lysidine synthase [Bryobacterales bacterium]